MKTKRPQNKKSSVDDQFMAAAIGDVEWLRQSLRNPQGEVCFDRSGLAAIHLAALHGRLECLRFLIESCKSDVNLASKTGWRPIHLSISSQTGKRSFQCLLFLLEKGASHDVINDDKTTPAHQAATEGHLEALEMLIKLGAKIDSEDCRGYLPIDLAKIWGHKKCARLLAIEMWHREKDDVAKKMQLLKKQRTKEVLEEFQMREKLEEDMKYSGNEPFQEWISEFEQYKQNKNKEKSQDRISEENSKPVEKTSKDSSSTPRSKVTKRYIKDSRVPKQKRQDASREDLQKNVRSDKQTEENLRDEESDANENRQPTEIRDENANCNKTKDSPKDGWKVNHKDDWNFSCHSTYCFHAYEKMLPDVYPRDEYTKLPHPRKSYPLELNVLAQEPLAILKGEPQQQVIQDVARGQVEIIESRKEKAKEFELPSSRGKQLFKCQTIQDVQKRKRSSDILKRYRGEAAVHLIHDPKSILFQEALALEDKEDRQVTVPNNSSHANGSIYSFKSDESEKTTKSSKAS